LLHFPLEGLEALSILSEIVGPKARVLGDARKHYRPDLVAIMECKYVVIPPMAREHTVGNQLAV
jgi:hypothetical protein